MSRFHSYINSATFIIEKYDGKLPLAVYLKQFFAQEKKFGSKDRKWVTTLCYQYFRLNRVHAGMQLNDAVILSHFFCENKPSGLLKELNPGWNEAVESDLIHKQEIAGTELKPELIFPFQNEIGGDIDKEKFSFSHLQQPILFIRLRPNGFNAGMKKLMAANIDFKLLDNNCVELPNGTKVDEILMLDKEFVVQDFSSQQTGQVVKSVIKKPLFNTFYWDCCAASGGKTILLNDLYAGLEITVSDIRLSILENLHKRFKDVGIKNYRSFTADLTKPIDIATHRYFDWIVADVPCTGSGTWARTPEELFFFDAKTIDTFVVRQKNIVKNALPHLRNKGYFIYITCSVFGQENDGVAKYLEQQGLTLIKKEYLKGYENKADTMFIAIFKKAARNEKEKVKSQL